MKRLVYSPSVNVWIKTDTGVFDLSPYVTDFQIDRRVSQVSSAQVTFRNPRVTDERDPKKTRFMFTEHIANDGSVRPMFHPMDPIIITLTRLKGRPIQVFTGYCDTTPYIQLLPGPATLTASCTLKRLQYTYWDPALPFVRDFMMTNGWLVTDSGTTLNVNAEQSRVKTSDSSLGGLLMNVLTEVGGWSANNIYIQGLPSRMSEIVTQIYKDTVDAEHLTSKELDKFLFKILGASSYGVIGSQSDNSTPGDAGPSPVLPSDAPELIKKWKDEADRIAGLKTEYQSGEGERQGDYLNNPPKTSSGALIFDCSSFVSYMLHFIGKLGLNYAPSSDTFLTWAEPGKGKYLTVWTKGPAGPNGHVFFEFMKSNSATRFIGTTSSAPAGHTVAWHSHPTAGFTARHIEGF